MSAAISPEIDGRQSGLTGVGQNTKPAPSARVKTWTAMLSLITPPFTFQRVVSAFTEEDGGVRIGRIDGGFIKTTLAILTGLITLYGAYKMLPTPPTMAVSAGKDLTVSYYPQKKLVRLVFNVRAEEFGSKPNQIRTAKAWVEQPLTPRHPLHIGEPEFEENNSRIYEPIIPAGPSPKNMQCSICVRLDDSSRAAFETVGLRRLMVEFKDKAGQAHRVTFCFNIENDQLLTSEEKKFQYFNEDMLCPDQSS